jgi:hypothetical protein
MSDLLDSDQLDHPGLWISGNPVFQLHMDACHALSRHVANPYDHQGAHNLGKPFLGFVIISYCWPVLNEEKLDVFVAVAQFLGTARIELEEVFCRSNFIFSPAKFRRVLPASSSRVH